MENLSRGFWRGVAKPGGEQPARVGRNIPIKANDLPDAQQAQPIRLIYGTVKVSGTFMTPLFNISATPLRTNAGK